MTDTEIQSASGQVSEPGAIPVWEKALLAGVAALSFLSTMFAFLPALGSRFLLDEQFIAAWSHALLKGTAAGGWGTFLCFRGVDAQDAFGPLASLSCLLLSLLVPAMAKLVSMVVHSGCSVALYLVARQLTREFDAKISLLISISAALIFAIHPLSAELINFIGAIGIELSVLFFALSFNFYLAAHPIVQGGFEIKSRKNSILAVIFFLCACLAYAKSWYLLKIIALFEILNFALNPAARENYKQLFKEATTPGRQRYFITVAALTAVSIGFMSLEMARGQDPIGSLIAMIPKGLKSNLLSTMFPINRLLWKKYTSQYILLDAVFALAAALSVYGIVFFSKYRVALFTFMAWVFFGLLVGGNQSLVADDFYGHRYLAHAQAGMSLLIPMLCFGTAAALNQRRLFVILATIPALALCLIFTIASARHSFMQSNYYKASSKLLTKIQKSAAIISGRAQVPYCIVKDLPRRIAFSPLISPYRPVLIDAANGLLRAPTVSGGALKDALAAGRLAGSTARWDFTFDSLVPIVVEPKTNVPDFVLDANQIAASFYPPIAYWKTVSFDKQEKCVSISSNSEHEPGISLFSRVLSPLDGDLFYIDARIKTPVPPKNPNVELSWMTLNTGDFEKEDRRSLAIAQLNDDVYHRYLLSLRTTGWAINGPPTQLVIGFPSSSSAQIKELGIIKDKGIFAKIGAQKTNSTAGPSRFSDLCFNYPDDADLGLYHIEKTSPEVNITYDVAAIAGSARSILICGQADQVKLPADCGELPADSSFKTELNGTSGALTLGLDRFPKTGLYGLRVAAVDANGKPVGKFSDTIWLLVDKSM